MNRPWIDAERTAAPFADAVTRGALMPGGQATLEVQMTTDRNAVAVYNTIAQ